MASPWTHGRRRACSGDEDERQRPPARAVAKRFEMTREQPFLPRGEGGRSNRQTACVNRALLALLQSAGPPEAVRARRRAGAAGGAGAPGRGPGGSVAPARVGGTPWGPRG